MSTLQRLNPEVLELDSETPNEQAWLGGGCLILAFACILGISALCVDADGGPFRWIGLAGLTALGLGIVVTGAAFQLQESFLLAATGVRLRRRWLGHTREHWLARADQIHCLALDCSNRGPRSWRLMLVCRDGQTHELAGYARNEEENQRWKEMCRLAAEVASALAAPLHLPEGVERERQLHVSPGLPPSVDYPELVTFSAQEVKGMAALLFGFLAFIGVVCWLHFQGFL